MLSSTFLSMLIIFVKIIRFLKFQKQLISWFWTIVKDEFDLNEQKRLLLFTTGSDRIPIGGVKEMSFKITRIESKNQYF